VLFEGRVQALGSSEGVAKEDRSEEGKKKTDDVIVILEKVQSFMLFIC